MSDDLNTKVDYAVDELTDYTWSSITNPRLDIKFKKMVVDNYADLVPESTWVKVGISTTNMNDKVYYVPPAKAILSDFKWRPVPQERIPEHDNIKDVDPSEE